MATTMFAAVKSLRARRANKAVAKKESWKNMAKCCLCWKILLTFADETSRAVIICTNRARQPRW